MIPRLETYYKEEVVPRLMKEMGYKTLMQVPKITKITLNMGLSEAASNKDVLTRSLGNLEAITGQKPVATRARLSIAGFKIREGWPIGAMVTLRRAKMYEFLDRFISIAAPRIRDFRGFSAKAFDGRGNYALGITEHIIFPEIDYDKIDKIRGMNVVVTTTAKTDKEALALLLAFGFPIKVAEKKAAEQLAS